MKKGTTIVYTVLFLAGILSLSSCNGKKKTDSSSMPEHEEASAHHQPENETAQHAHGEEMGGHAHGEEAPDNGGSSIWTPSGDAVALLASDFHYITGATQNIAPKMVETEGVSTLELTADGTPTAFVFHKTYGNIGMIAAVDPSNFNGTLKLIHHAKSTENYEFVSINGNHLKLGRIVNGKETIFDEGDFESTSGWINLRASAAGTHFKGYLNDKMVTHGHGDKMPNGFVGIMLEGTGKLMLRSIEIAQLEDE
ncbi:hypothetical protein [Roseivirga pacifica]|nr:hypothetical protein [Roseivirga pacifica]MCO6359193.1 hypothetical protein [Roseivirga pacifica]MCO6365171.1 hypothetical protein [Roseivirga pacifica]MCO6372099.1 hypothetical protein [Roseivirga pacifica]MCO6375790.1 hypothetical protein [Roseivirga pacifica]MCO6379477.1 hypothetical protein [Roseivirga pacifica]